MDEDTTGAKLAPWRGRPSVGVRALLVAVAACCALATFAALGYGEELELDGPDAAAKPALAHAPLARPVPTVPVAVTIDAHRAGRRVPADFLGLSFEVSSLPQIAQYGTRGNLVALLRSLGRGVLRFGGVSADTRVAWSDSADPPAAWASSVLTPLDLRGLAQLLSASGWHTLLTLGLAHFEPAAIARETATAKAELGHALVGVEIGNEPDAYMRHALREAPWGFPQYAPQARAYLNAIRPLAPHVALAGPDASGSAAFEAWGRGEAALRPRLLTGHHYPLGCHQLPAPSIERLLDARTRHAEDGSLARYMRVASAAHIPFRLDETNSVSCGGRPGISDTFASALWAVSYIARAMAAGVSGINFHGNPANCRGYAPLCAPTPARLATGALSVRPEWYALLLARQLVGDRGLRTSLRAGVAHGAPPPNVSVTALRAANGAVHLVVVDDDPPGSPRLLLHIHVGSRYRQARELALTGPSPSAGSGVLLGGRTVAADGGWSQPARLPTAARKDGVLAAYVAPSSALLLTLR
ncbi:MAG TPA: hypothetical protein VGX51_08820 [Solirubrobacteraceae bacterium]|nr:hypothetical protein [Solirubrobacteraceae bacterium]